MEKLPPNLDISLRAIHLKTDEALPADDIKKLLLAKYVDHDLIRGGWRTTSKGREYIKRFKIPTP
jgi:hypothetical protein